MQEFQRVSQQSDIVYIASHGRSPGIAKSQGNANGSGWSLLFDKGSLSARDFFSERIKLPQGAVVVLSACSVGKVIAREVHEIEGLVQAFFYAGAATILAARWPIFYETADTMFTRTIEYVYQARCSFGSALRKAIIAAKQQEDVKQLMSGPCADLFFWGPFAVFGCGT